MRREWEIESQQARLAAQQRLIPGGSGWGGELPGRPQPQRMRQWAPRQAQWAQQVNPKP